MYIYKFQSVRLTAYWHNVYLTLSIFFSVTTIVFLSLFLYYYNMFIIRPPCDDDVYWIHGYGLEFEDACHVVLENGLHAIPNKQCTSECESWWYSRHPLQSNTNRRLQENQVSQDNSQPNTKYAKIAKSTGYYTLMAFGGGGFAAMTNSMAIAAILSKHNLWSHIDMISGNSGGTWFGHQFVYNEQFYKIWGDKRTFRDWKSHDESGADYKKLESNFELEFQKWHDTSKKHNSLTPTSRSFQCSTDSKKDILKIVIELLGEFKAWTSVLDISQSWYNFIHKNIPLSNPKRLWNGKYIAMTNIILETIYNPKSQSCDINSMNKQVGIPALKLDDKIINTLPVAMELGQVSDNQVKITWITTKSDVKNKYLDTINQLELDRTTAMSSAALAMLASPNMTTSVANAYGIKKDLEKIPKYLLDINKVDLAVKAGDILFADGGYSDNVATAIPLGKMQTVTSKNLRIIVTDQLNYEGDTSCIIDSESCKPQIAYQFGDSSVVLQKCQLTTYKLCSGSFVRHCDKLKNPYYKKGTCMTKKNTNFGVEEGHKVDVFWMHLGSKAPMIPPGKTSKEFATAYKESAASIYWWFSKPLKDWLMTS